MLGSEWQRVPLGLKAVNEHPFAPIPNTRRVDRPRVSAESLKPFLTRSEAVETSQSPKIFLEPQAKSPQTPQSPSEKPLLPGPQAERLKAEEELRKLQEPGEREGDLSICVSIYLSI